MGVGLGRMITVDKGACDELEDFVEKDDWYRDLQHGPPLENGQRAEGEDNLGCNKVIWLEVESKCTEK